MKFYDKQEAKQTLEAILSTYDKRALSSSLSSLATSLLKENGAIVFPNLDNIQLIKQDGKYSILINSEE
jgi:hypothetical protein